MPNNSGLGRGLGSLIPDKKSKKEPEHIGSMLRVNDKNKILEVELEKIKVNPMQPRKKFTDTQLDELVDSIKEYGVIQPLVVSREGGDYELIAGERRFRASEKAGLKKVPVIVREVDDQEKLEVAIIENVQRENLNPIDLATAYRKMTDKFGMSQEEVAKKVGKSRPAVANTLRFLKLPEEIQLALIDGKISEGHGKYLAGIESEDKQMTLFRKIVRNQLSVADTSRVVRKLGGTKEARIKINYKDKDKEFALREFFGSKAEIRRKKKGGQITIDFFSDEELDEIIKKVK